MITVGRLCVKITGREAGSKCVVVDVIDGNFVTIDGNVRRKRCNISHLEPLRETVDITKGATHEQVVAAFEKLGIAEKQKKTIARKPKQATEKKEIAEMPVSKSKTASPKKRKTTKKPVNAEKE